MPLASRLPVAATMAALVLTGILHALSLGAEEKPPSPAPQSRYVVAAMGDSLTDHRGGGGRFLDYLRKQCPKSRFDNYGQGGEMVNQMRRRFPIDVLGPTKPTYTHVIVFGGVNDLYSDLTAKRTPEKIQKDLLHMYEMANQAGIEVIAITVAPWGGFRRYFNERRGHATLQVNQWIGKQREEGKVDHVIDAYGLLSCGDSDGDSERLCAAFTPPFDDGLHFNRKGHEVLGKALFENVFSDCR